MRIQMLEQKGCGLQNCSSQSSSALFPTSSLLKMKGLLTLEKKEKKRVVFGQRSIMEIFSPIRECFGNRGCKQMIWAWCHLAHSCLGPAVAAASAVDFTMVCPHELGLSSGCGGLSSLGTVTFWGWKETVEGAVTALALLGSCGEWDYSCARTRTHLAVL